jgi:hypothetical protein
MTDSARTDRPDPSLDRVVKRRGVTGRVIRHAVAMTLSRLIPPFGRWLGMHTRWLSYDEGARATNRSERLVENPLTEADRAFIVTGGRRFEEWTDPDYALRDPLAFTREAFVAQKAFWAAFSGGISVASPVRAMLTPHGDDPGKRRNRPMPARRRRALKGVSVPCAPSNNVWHFHELFTLPLLAHMESGAAPRPDAILMPPRPLGVQACIAPVLAAHYGLELVTTALRDEIETDLLIWRQTRPCTEWLDIEPAHLILLRSILRKGLGVAPPARPSGLLYLDRGRGARVLRPEPGVAALLAQRGFTSFVAHGGNVPEQVARFSEARVVLAAHGAGLANLMFCEPGGALLEVLPTDLQKSTYRMLARQTGLDYRAEVALRGGFRDPLEVDLGRIEAGLAALGA